MSLFIPITKIDVAKQLVYGTLSEEIPDKTGEVLDYESSKPAFLEWSRQFQAASGGKSMGNVRAMHGNVAAGKLTDIDFDDAGKRITGVARIVDAEEWQKVLEGVYTGFSIGGGYARRWRDAENPALMRYTPVLTEVSLVDNPAVPTATFEVVKRDGTVECRKFVLNTEEDVARMAEDKQQEHKTLLLKELDWLAQDISGSVQGDIILPHITELQKYCIGEKTQEMVKRTDFRSALLETVNELQKRITHLEQQPVPARGSLRALSKADDRKANEENHAVPTVTDLMKMALANPRAV